MIAGQVKAVCVMRNFAYACWLLRDFSYQYQDIRYDDGPNSDLSLFLLGDFSQGIYCVIADLAVFVLMYHIQY
jgi:hypothetical protein